MKKSHPKKQIHKIAHKETASPVISFQNIFIISGFITVLVIVFVITHKRAVLHSVQGIAIVKGLYNEAIIPLPSIPNAVAFNIYYDQANTSTVHFTHAVRNIPATTTDYTIQYLKKNMTYQYQISAIDNQGKEVWFSPITPITNEQGM